MFYGMHPDQSDRANPTLRSKPTHRSDRTAPSSVHNPGPTDFRKPPPRAPPTNGFFGFIPHCSSQRNRRYTTLAGPPEATSLRCADQVAPRSPSSSNQQKARVCQVGTPIPNCYDIAMLWFKVSRHIIIPISRALPRPHIKHRLLHLGFQFLEFFPWFLAFFHPKVIV